MLYPGRYPGGTQSRMNCNTGLTGCDMKILAVDTATAACSAALMSDGEIIAARHEAMMRGHAEALLPMVEAVMAGVAYDTLGLIAATVGPGAFTGLRVGLAAARGLALAGGLPMIGVTPLEALAHGAGESRGERSVVAVLNARREEVYYQPFDGALTPLSPPRVGAAEAVELPEGPVLLVGDGADLIPAARDGSRAHVETMPLLLPDAAVVAAIAAARFDPTAPPDSPPEPLYLRSSGAREPATPQ